VRTPAAALQHPHHHLLARQRSDLAEVRRGELAHVERAASQRLQQLVDRRLPIPSLSAISPSAISGRRTTGGAHRTVA
jgi:hypothetical protein